MPIEQTTRSESALQGPTPGPWLADFRNERREGGRFVTYVRGGNQLVPIAAVPTGVEGYGRDEGRANAALIAAAPLLRDALIAAKQEMWLAARDQWTMADFKNWAVIQQIDAALDAARGVA